MTKEKYKVVGVVPGPEKKTDPKGEPFWRDLIKVWFDVYADKIPPDPEDGEKAKPVFKGAETTAMKTLVAELRMRAAKKNIEWVREVAKDRWRNFLEKSFEDDFISKNFMLRIICNNMTKIFNNQITPKKNEKNIGLTGRQKARGSEGTLGRDFIPDKA